jgi:predicted HTH transcriptional regulator
VDIDDLLFNVRNIGETRNFEIKRSISWNDSHNQFKITKSVISMSNIRDGGLIFIGAVQLPDNTFNPIGMEDSDYESFSSDLVVDHVSRFAEPHATFSLFKKQVDGKKFVVIKVEQFDEIPVIFKKDYCLDGEHRATEGDFCTRTRGRRPRSAKVTRADDLREILDLAIDKGVTTFVMRANKAGLTHSAPATPSDEELFDKEINEMV